jgi:hypothetical protein
MRVLHISDLHFGIADSKKITEEEKRERAYFFEDLLVGLKKITEKSPVDYALVTGNITFEASWKGYQEAEEWLEELAQACGISLRQIYLCPGEYELSDGANLSKYSWFCKNLGLPAYHFGGEENYLAGVAQHSDFRIICADTLWFTENMNKKAVWEAADCLKAELKTIRNLDGNCPTVAVLRRPLEYGCNQYADTLKVNALYEDLCRTADLILTGGACKLAATCLYRGNAMICGNGAAIHNGRYQHNFHIYDFGSGEIARMYGSRLLYEFDGRSWRRENLLLKYQYAIVKPEYVMA